MDKILRDRAKLFGKYVSAEIKGAIVANGYTQTDVAKAIDRQGANLSRWLNGKPVIPVEVAMEVCDYIGVDIRSIMDRAERRVVDELGPWPPVEMDEQAKIRLMEERIKAGGLGLAANDDEMGDDEGELDAQAGA